MLLTPINYKLLLLRFFLILMYSYSNMNLSENEWIIGSNQILWKIKKNIREFLRVSFRFFRSSLCALFIHIFFSLNRPNTRWTVKIKQPLYKKNRRKNNNIWMRLDLADIVCIHIAIPLDTEIYSVSCKDKKKNSYIYSVWIAWTYNWPTLEPVFKWNCGCH